MVLCQFPQDAAKQQRHYIYMSFFVDRPPRMNVPNFVSRMEQLNGYILHLSCRKDCLSISTPTTERMNCSFNENDLSGILNYFPKRYEDHYYLNNGSVPSEISPLCDKLVQIEKVVGNYVSAVGNSTTSKDKSTIDQNDLLKETSKRGVPGS